MSDDQYSSSDSEFRRRSGDDSSGSEGRAPSTEPMDGSGEEDEVEAAGAAGGDTAGRDAFGFHVQEKDLTGLRRVDTKKTTLVLNPAMVDIYHKELVGQGLWERKARRDMRERYYLSTDQRKQMEPPSVKGCRISHALRGVDTSTTGRALLAAHEALRGSAGLNMRAYEASTSASRAVSGFAVTQVFRPDGRKIEEFSMPAASSIQLSEEDARELARMERWIGEDAGRAAKLLLRMKMAMRLGSDRLQAAVDKMSAAEELVGQNKLFIDTIAPITWDALQITAQGDLQVSEARRSLIEQKLTDRMRTRIKAELADPEKRKKRDSSNQLVVDGLDRLIAEEARTNSRLHQVGGGQGWCWFGHEAHDASTALGLHTSHAGSAPALRRRLQDQAEVWQPRQVRRRQLRRQGQPRLQRRRGARRRQEVP